MTTQAEHRSDRLETYDAEVVEEQPRELERYQPPPAPMTLLGDGDPEESLVKAEAVATALDKRVRARGLFTKMGKKDHLHVEAWTMLGSLLGVFPVIVWTRSLEEGSKLLGWEARCEARTIAGAVVGAAESECRFDETTIDKYGKETKRWLKKPSTEVRGMAQTRAISRAMRAPLGFVAELAGYAATPEAEMPREDGAPESAGAGEGAPMISDAQHRKIGALLKELDEVQPKAEGQLSWVAEVRERFKVQSRKDLTRAQASEAIEWLEKCKADADIPFG